MEISPGRVCLALGWPQLFWGSWFLARQTVLEWRGCSSARFVDRKRHQLRDQGL